ncbi:ribonuclease E activity regulator RraA [Bacillus sp. FJAT-45037]|uniref:ribonuclease E activity regulator RraA n=1 Tax=Bacillus sp. FJAT-45037 TaxID=2011007 RepID=UPI000C2447D7|nr:ribonuclease E activity regulator RraA [Bacillus sp. FJAT-45037]
MFHTADLCDQFREQLQVADPILRHYGKKRSFTGPISTIKVFEDNVLVKSSLESIPKGHVLVVDGGGSTRCALIGDNLAEIAISRELAGIVVYGCIRDSSFINEMNIGIRALGTNPMKSIKQGKGDVDIPLQFAGIVFKPGHTLYADGDGIIVSETCLLT